MTTGFQAPSTYAAGSDPQSVVTADVNGDGRLDLLVTDYSGGVSVLLGNGSGGFGAATTYAAGPGPEAVAVADLNGDGRLDLAVADYAGGVAVLLGNGSGGFATATTYAAGPHPVAVTTADLTGDGRLDLVVADYGGGVAVLLGNGSGGFEAATTYAAGPSPVAVTSADVNGDGKPDLVVADVYGGVSVLLGNGSGGFAAPITYAAGPYPGSVATADLNHDGRLDLVVADHDGGVAVLLGTATTAVIAITASASVSGPLRVGSTVIFTVTPEQAVAVTGAPTLALSDGGIASYNASASTPTSLVFNYTVAAAQTASDLLVTGLDLNGATITVPGTLSFAAASLYAVGQTPYSVTVADVNGDGKPDLVVANNMFDGTVEVLLGTGSGGFEPSATYSAGYFPGSVTVADLTGDGKRDLVVADQLGGVSVLLNNGSGSFSSPVSYMAGPSSAAVTTADVSGDGILDLVVADADGAVWVLPGYGNGRFGTPTSYAAGPDPDSVTASDLTGDGKPDLVVADRLGGVAVLLNNGSGGFDSAVTYAAGPSPSAVTTADLLGNGRLDLIVADEDGGVAVLLGNGSGGFGPAITYAAGPEPVSVVAADVNGDGIPDLVVADYGYGGGVSVLLGNGQGGFGAPISYAAGTAPLAVTTADVNDDGRPDIVVANYGGGVSVLLNQSTPSVSLDPTTVASAVGADTGLVVDTASPVACYASGTRITAASGEVEIDDLSIGDEVLTASGRLVPIRWIGRRSYAGRLVLGRRDILPVCIAAGALAPGLPRRDLTVSPQHGMYIDGVLVPAVELVNGVSIVQCEDSKRIDYIHLELDRHDVIFAEGAMSETFVDDGSRQIFHNAAEYHALYPGVGAKPALYCAPRVDSGYKLAAIRQRSAIRAGLRAPARPERLRGSLDRVSAFRVEGWAQNPDRPEVPVCLDVLLDGVVVVQTLANLFRADLREAGLGSGWHGFLVPVPMSRIGATIEVRRSSDQRLLPLLIGRWTASAA
jgi:hypothetical protein